MNVRAYLLRLHELQIKILGPSFLNPSHNQIHPYRVDHPEFQGLWFKNCGRCWAAVGGGGHHVKMAALLLCGQFAVELTELTV